jgi:hypothetical protein
MSMVIFETEEAIFQFDRKPVMELLELRKSSYDVQELDTLTQVLSSQPDQTILSSAEHQYFGYIALNLIKSSEGYAVCKSCEQKYSFNQIQAFNVGPDKATFKAVTSKKGGLKSLFRKKPKLPGMYGSKGYRCLNGHTLIFMVTWIT